jgi:hypothetical protein
MECADLRKLRAMLRGSFGHWRTLPRFGINPCCLPGSEICRTSRREAGESQLGHYIQLTATRITAKTALGCGCHRSLAYSDLASFRMGMSGSASFQSVRKSLYAARARTRAASASAPRAVLA